MRDEKITTNKLQSTDRIINDLCVEVDDLNIVVDEKSQQYNIKIQMSSATISGRMDHVFFVPKQDIHIR